MEPRRIGQHDIWRALDRLAAERGLSPSGLARAAGLDPTAFNPSKRIGAEGRRRWPSTESLVRCLHVLGVSFERFARIAEGADGPVAGGGAAVRAVPMVAYSRVSDPALFDRAGMPHGRGWDEWLGPALPGLHVYAVRMDRDVLHPVGRLGSVLVVAPGAVIGEGDRVLACGVSGVQVGIVRAAGSGVVRLAGFVEGECEVSFDAHRVHRIALVHF